MPRAFDTRGERKRQEKSASQTSPPEAPPAVSKVSFERKPLRARLDPLGICKGFSRRRGFNATFCPINIWTAATNDVRVGIPPRFMQPWRYEVIGEFRRETRVRLIM